MSHDPEARRLVDELCDLLRVAPAGDDRFVGARTPLGAGTGTGRVFGGLVIGQALAAAEQTVDEDRPAHSLHAYFLRAGDDTRPIDYAVMRDLDGRSFSNRRTVASQGEKPILSLTASFMRRADGFRHQDPMPEVPGPEGLASNEELRRTWLDKLPPERRQAFGARRPIEQRSIEEKSWMTGTAMPPVSHTWFRAIAPLGDDPRLHRAVLAYASDFTLLATATLPHGISWMKQQIREASLDHAVWFHDDFRADEWLLYVARSGWAGRARGFVTGQIFAPDGRLVASVAQEGMLRLVEQSPA
ncbi:MAG: acyl-CoA thioesterase II [Novosphingobium sp.]|nr:acyl-CoA thioesterase II [Novosphingobium sp.]